MWHYKLYRHAVSNVFLTACNSGQILTQVPLTKYLGVFIDQNLTLAWQKHFLNMSFRGLGGSVLFISLAASTWLNLISIVCGFILPIFDYCDTVWAPPTAFLWNEYMPVLLVTCVMILGLLRLLWQNATTFLQLFKYIKFYITLYLVTYLQDMFMFSENLTGYVGRNMNSHRLFIPRMWTTYGQKVCFIREW